MDDKLALRDSLDGEIPCRSNSDDLAREMIDAIRANTAAIERASLAQEPEIHYYSWGQAQYAARFGIDLRKQHPPGADVRIGDHYAESEAYFRRRKKLYGHY